MPQILDNALGAVGQTPLIRLDNVAKLKGLKCNLLGKVEYMSAGGSVKDRIAKAMVEAAEKEGKLVPGKSVVIEPTSGNTGIGLAMACAIKGYAVIITLPNKMSLEKEAALRALGAEVVRTPTEAAWDSPESHIGVAQRLQQEIPHGIILDQYRNVSHSLSFVVELIQGKIGIQINNPLAHEYTTGPEIIEAVVSTPSTHSKPSSGKVDVVVAGAGTGGTVTGISRAIKKTHNKDCVVIGVDPNGSILAFPDELNKAEEGTQYVVEGIGYDFIPDVLSRDVADVDSWIKTSDEEAFAAVQVIMRAEGLLVGGSSGSALSGALCWLSSDAGRKVAETEGLNVVVLFPDGIRNYMSKPWFLKIALESDPSPLAGANLNDVLRDLKSSKITERRDALASFRSIFERPNFIDNFHLDDNGIVEPRAWLGVFQALFTCVLQERAALTKKETSKSATTSAAVQRRLEDAASAVRWLTERTVHLMSRRVTKPVFEHLLQTLVYQRKLLAPVALHYMKALRCLLGHTPHLEHLDDDNWIKMLEMGFNCLLQDPVGSTFKDDVEMGSPEVVDNSELFEEDQATDEDVFSSTSRKRARGNSPTIQPRSKKSTKRARSTPQPVSVSREQVECMSLISILLGSSSSPIVSLDHSYLPASILARLQRFLDLYAGDTSLLHDYVNSLSSTLSHLSLNRTFEVAKFARGTWDALIGLWGTKNKRIKEGLVSIFRVLLPFATTENEYYHMVGMHFDPVDALCRLSSAIDGETDNRWGIDGLSLDCLRLEIADVSILEQAPSAFIAKTFRYGWDFDNNQALAWAVLELQADCTAKLFQISESMHPPSTPGPSHPESKRLRKVNPIASLLTTIKDTPLSNIRSYLLQTLLFFIDRHWAVLHFELQVDVVNALQALVPLDDGVVQSWVFLCYAAIASNVASSSGLPEATWYNIWQHAIRRTNSSVVSRAACHAAHAILIHTRAHTQIKTSAQLPLASNQVLAEIEALAKDLDIQGPPSPCDSVCVFLATCLRVASQDMHLYRMQLEEKVLSWLIDCWQIAGFRNKSLSLHTVKDLQVLIESICGFSRLSNFAARVPLPEGPIVDTLVDEARFGVIRDYILAGQLPQYRSKKESDELIPSSVPTYREPIEGSLMPRRGRERRISAFLLKSLERLQIQWDENHVHPTAESARRSLDTAVTALCFESTLTLNGMQNDRSLIRCACKLLNTVTSLLPDSRWTTAERTLICLGLDPLTFVEDSANDSLAWIALLPPDVGSGIKSQLLKKLPVNSPNMSDIRSGSRLDFLRAVWQNAEIQSTFNNIIITMRDVLRISFGDKAISTAQNVADGDEHDGFGPIRMATEQSSVHKDEATTNVISNRYTMDVCISFLTIGPALQSTSGEPTRDKELVDDVSKCAESRPEAFLAVLPVLFGKIRQHVLDLSIKSIDTLLNDLSRLLELYQYSRSHRLQSVVIQFLASTLNLWASGVTIGDIMDKISQLCQWLAANLRKSKIRSWEVRDLFARFMDQYLLQDPDEHAWDFSEDGSNKDLLPSSLLPEMGRDDDTRVRFRVAALNGHLFAHARRAEPRRPIDNVYLAIKDKLTLDPTNFEHMLTRTLSLGNIMIVASATRRGAYWHLLETFLHSPLYDAHIEAVLRGVSQRLGFHTFSVLFENYASQLAYSLRQVDGDFIRFPPHLLGYRDRKECVVANFRSFAPVNIWHDGENLFENHCKIASLSLQEGLRDCFGSLLSFRLVDEINGNEDQTEDNMLLQLLKSTIVPEEEFDSCLVENVDSIVASILSSLGVVEIEPIIHALNKEDYTGYSAETFRGLVRYRNNDVETHLPNLPAFPAETVLRALRWLRSQAPSMDARATSYHIIHQLLANLDRSPLVNEQLRLINSICLWIATHSRDFEDLTLLHTLLHGATAFLSQPDLATSAQSILDWAFKRYRKGNTKHCHVPDILVRIAYIANDFSRATSDPALTSLGVGLLQWIDGQVFELSKVQNFSGQVMEALPAWPHQPSPNLAQLFDSLSGDHLSDALKDHRILSSKFRVVRRLREHALSNVFDKDRFAEADFWRLKECIPPPELLQDADVDAFATLLYLSKGQLGSFRHESMESTPVLSRYRRNVSKAYGSPDGTSKMMTPQEPIVLMLLDMLRRDLPSQTHAAYETLRLIQSVARERSSYVPVSSSEHVVELEYLSKFHRPAISRASQGVEELITTRSYLDSVVDFPRWVAEVTTLFSTILSSNDPFYAQMIPILQKDTNFAEQVLPILVHTILLTEKQEARNSGIAHAQHRDIISRFFASVLSEVRSSKRCLRSVIDVVLHLRHFHRDPPPPQPQNRRARITQPPGYDALSYNKWLLIEYSLLARCSIVCGAYTTALLFLELASDDNAGSSSTSNDILYEIYRHIDEPDGFYGIHDPDLHQNLIKRFHHENQWEKAFRFHGAAFESGDMASHTEGLVKSFHSFGFDRLANDALRGALTSSGAQDDNGRPHDMSYKLAWRTETWDLPESVGHSSGSSLYLALRAIHRERDDRTIDRTIRRCLHQEMVRLRVLGIENFAEIRDIVRDVMCLHEISRWRRNPIQASSATKELTGKHWDAFVNIESDFDFSILENILATRISLVRSVRQKEERQRRIGSMVMSTPFYQSLVGVETGCLVRLSEAAREADEVQVALNSIVRAMRMEKPPSFRAFKEFACVLWSQKEEKAAVEYLDRLRAADWGIYVRDSIGDEKKALALAQLGSWSSTACLKKPEDVQKEYFSAASDLLDRANSSKTLGIQVNHATVYHQCAIFAERQYHDVVKSPDALRWKIYTERKRREIQTRGQEISKLPASSKSRSTLQNQQYQAIKLMEADSESSRRHDRAREEFLEQAISMYSRCLEISDAYDQDAPIRLCSLWFANFDNDRATFQMAVKNALERVPSRKFVFLSHQLSARISSASTAALPEHSAQRSLQTLVLRMCKEHPFHILYQVYCLQPPQLEPPSNRRQSQQLQPPPPVNIERTAAAADIFNRLRDDPIAKERLMSVELLSKACVDWAKQPCVVKKRYCELSNPWPLGDISNLQVPVITHHTPIDPSMKYNDCPWIDHYEKEWTPAGGKNAPKIGICVGTDGVKYKQLFKGQGQDDLRQDAVMEQVFDLVNGILRRDRETRRRALNVRDYKVIPLAMQAGILEFVGNTQPLKDWLNPAHLKYHPSEPLPIDLFNAIAAVRKDENATTDLRGRLLRNWRRIEEKVKPVMRHFFTEKHKTPNAWFATRLDYSRSLATSSIVGHILGLGDRHVSNILIDQVSGQIVPIDLGIAFDQGKLLGVPELVPFRLTRDMVDGLGMSGTAGVFQRCAEETLRVLRDGSEVIMTVLEVFKHDPLHSWTASETKIQQVQEGAAPPPPPTPTANTSRFGVDIGIDMTSGTAEEAADRALTSVSRKLDKSLSVQTVVSQLIREASDPVNLALMYE
ncbi:hypothetical protein H0H87_008383, partial [Tephrocybe sp. NHM501043]